MATGITVVPANDAGWRDVQTIFGTRGAAAYCQCQRYKLRPREAFKHFSVAERAGRLREQIESQPTAGLVAYLDDEPAGWCAVEPRPAYGGLVRVYRTPWEGRDEDRTDASVWAVTCVFARAGFRGRGVAHALVQAAVGHARGLGGRALEGYPLLTEAGERIAWDEIHVGTRELFASAGFTEVSRPSKRRVVMRIDL